MKQTKIYLFLLAAFSVCIAASCDDDEIITPIEETFTVYEESTFSKECDSGDEIDLNLTRVEDRGEGTGTMTWTRDRAWLLDGFVFVNEGQTLTIEPGTIVKGISGQGERASALIVARGATIIAEGTADMPIIFTAESDQLFRDTDGNLCSAGGLSSGTRGLWGGMMVLGDAGLNSTPGETAIEGIPTTEPRGLYGGTNDASNSGIIKYVSIRHGGTDIGAGNEINGLTMGGVGTGTTIEHVEVFANNDDGVEWFGGTVNTKYLAVSYCKDDGMDYDEGFRGMGQFWLVLQEGTGDSGGEHDGGTDPETAEPFAIPVIYNATYLGRDPDDEAAVRIRDNAGGKYFNSLFCNYQRGFRIEILPDDQDSYKQFQDGNLEFTNNVFHNVGTLAVVENSNEDSPVSDAAEDAANAALADYVANNNNVSVDNLDFVNRLVPATGTALDGAGAAPANSFFEAVDYKGAIKPGATNPWTSWTRLAEDL